MESTDNKSNQREIARTNSSTDFKPLPVCSHRKAEAKEKEKRSKL
jgi:hypothetical protein